jgi:hypothetical protein
MAKNRGEIKEEKQKAETIENLRERLENVADSELRQARNLESKFLTATLCDKKYTINWTLYPQYLNQTSSA